MLVQSADQLRTTTDLKAAVAAGSAGSAGIIEDPRPWTVSYSSRRPRPVVGGQHRRVGAAARRGWAEDGTQHRLFGYAGHVQQRQSLVGGVAKIVSARSRALW
jgi:hypothetical protein